MKRLFSDRNVIFFAAPRFMAQAAAAVLFAAVLCGCTGTPPNAPKEERSFFAMDTYMEMTVYGDNAEPALDSAVKEITRIEKLLSVTDEKSEVFALNSQSGAKVSVSPETASITARSLEISSDTGGAFDVTLYPISKEWGFTKGSFHVPDEKTIAALLEKTGGNNVHINGESITLESGTQIDLGGIAKGYAGQRAADILRDSGITCAILKLGGNVQTVGAKYDGTDWYVGIKDPQNTKLTAGAVAVSDKAVVTSGGYERYFEQDGVTYSHIIDPKTGCPTKSDILSATVIGGDGALCDALSTALLVMGKKDAVEFLSKHKEIDAVLITDDNTITVTQGLKGRFTPGSYTVNFLNEQ